MKRFLTAIAATGIGVLTVAGSASAATAQHSVAYPPSAAVLELSDSTVSPGEEFDATLRGCTPGETVQFSVEGSSTTATCDDNGEATGTLTAPMTPGTYEVSGVGVDSGVSASSTITVVGADDGEDGVLPATGSSTSGPLQVGGVLLVAGLGMLGVAKLRRRATA